MSESQSQSPRSGESYEDEYQDPLDAYSSGSIDEGDDRASGEVDSEGEGEYNEMEFLSGRRSRRSASSVSEEEVQESPKKKRVAVPIRRVVGSPKKEPSKAVPTRRVVGSPRKSKPESRPISKPEPRPKTLLVDYQYPGGLEVGEELLKTAEDVAEDLYPGQENNSVIARCAYFRIMYQSYYPLELQMKIEEVMEAMLNL